MTNGRATGISEERERRIKDDRKKGGNDKNTLLELLESSWKLFGRPASGRIITSSWHSTGWIWISSRIRWYDLWFANFQRVHVQPYRRKFNWYVFKLLVSTHSKRNNAANSDVMLTRACKFHCPQISTVYRRAIISLNEKKEKEEEA